MAEINPYGKLSEAEQERLVARRKTRRRVTIIVLSSVLLVAVIVATVVGVTQSKDNKSKGNNQSISNSIKAVCNATLYPDSCYNSLAPLVKSGNVFGQGFIARDMGFRNTAGPIKHQAVALMSTADLSVFYRCTFDAFQDTLYVHSNRQFYRECNIYGTVDFIFGNSAVVIQNSNIMPKKPMQGQQNTLTAQGRFDPNQNTGISIQNCTIVPGANLAGVDTFLGRPWKNYSTTVLFHNVMGGFIHPNGWMPWVGSSAPSTIFYAEFQNLGAGAVTRNRVKWSGLKLNLNAAQVRKFTVGPFVNGDKWIPATGVSYKFGL
ncbi:hypothetical protein RD792_013667 [Penstemon davidsonii]|uniref:Pectinesterase n=1 Tax=Penstemon davidsonii TaxID=160366 RepID=A0ABR0CU32_9LAMI|nr:hypothetical protein RD792_013667 [Penstemon davidsonii]